MKNKRGGIVGGFISKIVAIFAIVVILAGLVLVSGTWKRYSESTSEVALFGEDKDDSDFFNYPEDRYERFGKIRAAVDFGGDVKNLDLGGRFDDG